MQREHNKLRLMIELSNAEHDLIMLMRNTYRYGSIEVVTKNGQPVQILRTIERHLLGGE